LGRQRAHREARISNPEHSGKAERHGSPERSDAPAGGELGCWRPTPAQGALLAGICELVATRDVPAREVLEIGARRLAELLQETCVALLADGRWLHPLGVADPDPEVREVLDVLAGTRLPADRGFSRQVLASGTALRLTDPSREAVVTSRPEFDPYMQRFGLQSAILAPMRARGRALGVLAVLRRRGGTTHTADDERFVWIVADLLAMATGSAGPTDVAPAMTAGRTEPRDLSEREREILTLLVVGHTNREVAERLFLSVRTVEWHRARLQWKLGVSGRAALTRRARALGLVD
jgi:DNA-binding CsgD family transcriptional regulator